MLIEDKTINSIRYKLIDSIFRNNNRALDGLSKKVARSSKLLRIYIAIVLSFLTLVKQ
uniref:Uncharacterized protein n=1 Tax=Physcomitrium patens TaxID=3218 RepID=A0A2K1IBY4_PHYPA|nr:hypothetical protein PHYPA_030281 [Physcomitrium patens]